MNKIGLGTAQFGLNYGINNSRGKIPTSEINEILLFAQKNGIDLLDTAYAYGESEKVIGQNNEIINSFRIITKFPPKIKHPIKELFFESLTNLKRSTIYGYLIHDFQTYLSNKVILSILKELKSERKVAKIGFSLYYPDQLKYLFDNNLKIDIIQIPYNIFDRRFDDLLPLAKKEKIEVHIRSVFLQGLVFKDPKILNSHFDNFIPKLKKLNE
ncbi:MAG: aldo/keto reductase, partial [Spirochaetes bacterium]|nr:aldo/keto reductase [Spirochaetota bacterium]